MIIENGIEVNLKITFVLQYYRSTFYATGIEDWIDNWENIWRVLIIYITSEKVLQNETNWGMNKTEVKTLLQWKFKVNEVLFKSLRLTWKYRL